MAPTPSELEDAPIALTSKILRNRGVPVDVYRTAFINGVDEDGVAFDGWVAPVDDEDDPIRTKRDVKMTMNTMAEIEDFYGGFQQYQEAMQKQPYRAVRKVLALTWEWPEDRVGVALIEGLMPEYLGAVNTAMAIANGVDPTKAATMLQQGLEAARTQRETADREVQEILDQPDEEPDQGQQHPEDASGSAPADLPSLSTGEAASGDTDASEKTAESIGASG